MTQEITDAAVEACARAAHEANRAYCLAIGDTSQVAWESAPDWQRESAFNGVRDVLNGGGPEDSHKAWLEHKAADGWIYGPDKDPVAKTHPCMVPYADLPAEQRAKDDVFVSVVKAVHEALS